MFYYFEFNYFNIDERVIVDDKTKQILRQWKFRKDDNKWVLYDRDRLGYSTRYQDDSQVDLLVRGEEPATVTIKASSMEELLRNPIIFEALL